VTEPPVFTIEGLTLTTPAGKILVEDTHLTLGATEVALLVGPSGSGKSTFIKLLSGLLRDDGDPWRVTGVLRHEGQIYDLAQDRCDVGALVFQNYALFDDLTALANLGIALDHADRPDPALIGHTLGLLTDIDPDQTVASASGGQRQRIAIARTLLANRPLLLFDEPNSGLDPYTAQRLGILIRDLCRRMGRPALIVAHHVDDLLPLVDTVYLLDTRTRTLRAVPVDREAVDAALLDVGQAEESSAILPVAGAPTMDDSPWVRRLAPQSPQRWFLRYLQEYFWILWGSPLMLLYIFAGAAIVGFVIMWFGFNYDLLGDAVRSFVHDDALEGIGFIEANIGVPLITCILMVARNNAIITADLGNRVLSSQFLAMHNLHIPGRRYITTAIMLNTLVGGLVLVAASLAVAGWTSLHTWQLVFPSQPLELWQENFFHAILSESKAWLRLGWVVLKVLLSSACGAGLAIQAGLARKDSVIAVNYAIARSIVLGVTVTLVIHATVAVIVY
jgi:ABC-type nitrate/sulfonate/bicarbonate transport system ATPase subunit